MLQCQKKKCRNVSENAYCPKKNCKDVTNRSVRMCKISQSEAKEKLKEFDKKKCKNVTGKSARCDRKKLRKFRKSKWNDIFAKYVLVLTLAVSESLCSK